MYNFYKGYFKFVLLPIFVPSDIKAEIKAFLLCPTLVAQGVSAHLTGHMLAALLPQGELKE